MAIISLNYHKINAIELVTILFKDFLKNEINFAITAQDIKRLITLILKGDNRLKCFRM